MPPAATRLVRAESFALLRVSRGELECALGVEVVACFGDQKGGGGGANTIGKIGQAEAGDQERLSKGESLRLGACRLSEGASDADPSRCRMTARLMASVDQMFLSISVASPKRSALAPISCRRRRWRLDIGVLPANFT